MPLQYNASAVPSTLIDVIKQVRGALSQMANGTPLMVGKRYLAAAVGSAPRVVMVPEVGPGKLANMIEMGNAASVVHSCAVHVRGDAAGGNSELGDDERFQAAYDLADLVVTLLKTSAPGRIEWSGSYEDDSPSTTDDGAGVGLRFAFLYQRDIRHNVARWSLAAADADTSAPAPVPPPGIPASGATFTLEVEPPEEP